MANWNAQELYGDPEPTIFKRISADRMNTLEACERALNHVYREAREAKLIGEYAGLDDLLAAIRTARRS